MNHLPSAKPSRWHQMALLRITLLTTVNRVFDIGNCLCSAGVRTWNCVQPVNQIKRMR